MRLGLPGLLWLLSACAAAPQGEPRFTTRSGTGYVDLLHDGRPVHRHVTLFDANQAEATYKPFLHVFDSSGTCFLTKGPGGLYTHHRGLFLGWNKVRYGAGGAQQADFWHCRRGATIRHVGLGQHQDAALGYHDMTAVNHWVDADGVVVVRETRRVRTKCPEAGKVILDFDIVLEAASQEPVILGGDPHHAGFQFRASQQVADSKDKASYIRPEGATHAGNDVWNNCPWVLCRFTLEGRRIAVLYMASPRNPSPSQMSTRPYGRLGSFCKARLQPDKALRLRYRVVVMDGQSSGQAGPERWNKMYIDYAR